MPTLFALRRMARTPCGAGPAAAGGALVPLSCDEIEAVSGGGGGGMFSGPFSPVFQGPGRPRGTTEV